MQVFFCFRNVAPNSRKKISGHTDNIHCVANSGTWKGVWEDVFCRHCQTVYNSQSPFLHSKPAYEKLKRYRVVTAFSLLSFWAEIILCKKYVCAKRFGISYMHLHIH